MRLAKGQQVRVTDCTFSHNELSGAVVGGVCGDWHFEGCTMAGNGQFGIFVEGGEARVTWKQNTLWGNALGEKGGRGYLQGWSPGSGFQRGDECAAWSEERGSWLPGR